MNFIKCIVMLKAWCQNRLKMNLLCNTDLDKKIIFL